MYNKLKFFGENDGEYSDESYAVFLIPNLDFAWLCTAQKKGNCLLHEVYYCICPRKRAGKGLERKRTVSDRCSLTSNDSL